MRLFSSAGGGRKIAGVIAVALVIGATAGACGSSSKGDGAQGSSTQAATLLSKALSDYFSGNVEVAKSEFQQVVDLDPNNKYGWYNLGVIAQYANDKKGAEADYKKALALDANFEPVLYNLGVLRYGASDWDGAISYLRRAVAVNDKDANAWWNLGLALAHKHTKATDKESTDALNKALALNPKLIPNRATGASGASGALGASGASGASGAAPTTTAAG
jgi:Tfp pilus assembly protein PilF